jgi:HEPN domain-containing protein
MMELSEKYEYWLNHAKYDMETAEAMLNSGRWFYVVFMCQQAIEKLVKGLYTLYVDDNVPKAHNIKTLLDRFDDKLKEPVKHEYYQLFDSLTANYLGNRYPDFMNDAINSVDKDTAAHIIQKTKEAFTWLTTLKP